MSISDKPTEVKSNLNGHNGSHVPFDHASTRFKIGDRWFSDPGASGGGHQADGNDSASSIFTEFGPTEWAKPVAPTRFDIRRVLCEDTFGVNGAPKKSLKTHDNMAIGIALSSGKNLYLHPNFSVPRVRKVLYLIGEGGEKPTRRTLQRVARAYGMSLDEIMRDPLYPLVLEFGAAPLDSNAFRDEVRRLLDKHQPNDVLIESFYNFHPGDVESGNLFKRGQVIDSYHKMIRRECSGATSLITDHYRSTNVTKSLDLDNISGAGQAENADSWITRYNRKDPDVEAGDFYLRVGFHSRQWGATEWDIDWHLGRFDHEKGCHDGEITWEINAPKPKGVKEDSEPTLSFQSEDEAMQYLRTYVRDHPKMSQTQIQAVLRKDTNWTVRNLREVWAKAVESGWITTTYLKRSEGEATRTRPVWIPGEGKRTVDADKARWS